MFLLSGFSYAGNPDDDFLAAREAFRVGDIAKLESYAARLNNHPLEPYIAYWLVRSQLEQVGADTIDIFSTRYQDTLLAQRLRQDWMRLVGKRQDWQTFLTVLAVAEASDDSELKCFALRARHGVGDVGALRDAKSIWFTGRELPEACTPLFEALISNHILTASDIWARVRLALEQGHISVAKHIVTNLSSEQVSDVKIFDRALANPQRFLDKKSYRLSTRSGREAVIFALNRIAIDGPQKAFEYFKKISHGFSASDQSAIWRRLAYHAARAHDSRALEWFSNAGDDAYSNQELEWFARSALRIKRWDLVIAAIQKMPEQEQQSASWRYWKARALKAEGKIAEANPIFLLLAREYSYYGQLAGDELGTVISSPTKVYRPSENEISQVRQLPGIQRALAFYRLKLRYEGNREWQWAIRNLSDQQLLATAEVAKRYELYDRAIDTADRTISLHDFNLRYPTPYWDVLKNYTQQLVLDEALVYGVIRQESRFITSAQSSAGASGVMQLMPATARWVAKRVGLIDFRGALISDLNINLNLGTYYLKHVLDQLDDQPVVASAAYNAGPRRARRWLSETSAMEGAIYAETIPFAETREYVKKVMSNTSYYALQFGQKLFSLTQRLGIVGPRSEAGANDDEG